jgi:hypothetical protein
VVDVSEVSARVVAYIDRNHPKLGSRLMTLRWGGLRTVTPGRQVWAAIGLLGTVWGLSVRAVAGRRSDGRQRLALVPSALVGVAGAWAATWRVDRARWQRTHVTLVLDLPAEVLDPLIARLGEEGLEVQRRDGPRTVAGTPTGLACRLRDLRRVNAVLDELPTSAGQRPAPEGV